MAISDTENCEVAKKNNYGIAASRSLMGMSGTGYTPCSTTVTFSSSFLRPIAAVGDGSEKEREEKRMGDRGYGRRYKRAHDYLVQPFFTFYGERIDRYLPANSPHSMGRFSLAKRADCQGLSR